MKVNGLRSMSRILTHYRKDLITAVDKSVPCSTSHPSRGLTHFPSLCLAQRVLVVLGQSFLQVLQHGVWVIHGAHC